MKLKEDYKRELQLCMLDMIKEIDKLCQDNNIEYYLAFGSCLGAVRHKGFIPWDDDFDIAMTDDNYFKFLKVCEEKLDKGKYYVQTYNKEDNYYLSFAKIRNIQTTLIEESNTDKNITFGVYIDVFPLVGVPNSKIKREILKINRLFMLSSNLNVINNIFLKIISNIILKVFGRKRILDYTTKNCFKYKCSSCNKIVSIADGDGFDKNELDKNVYGKPKYVQFEDTFLPIPEDYTAYLSHIYGNYMKTLSRDEIKKNEHTPYFLDLKLPFKEYTPKKKLLFIIWSFTYGGGAEKVLSSIVNNLDNSKYEIDIIEYWHSNVKKEDTKENINILHPIIDSINDSRLKKLFYKILLESFPFLLRNKYIKKKYDIEISFNYLIPTFLLSHHTKTIAWVHGDVYDLQNNKKNYLLQKKSFKYVNKIVAISDNTYKSIEKVFPNYSDKLTLINNGFDIESILHKAGEEILKKENKKILLFINRLDENKNPLYALDVAKNLVDKGYDFKLQYLGKGELKESLINRINELKLNDYVEILGYKSNPYPYIKRSTIVLGCSKSEGFPTIFIEAIALGKPFVSTKVGGAQEISDNEKCGLVAENLEDYTNKVISLLDNEKKYNEFSKYGIKHSKKFTIETQMKKIEKLIREME